MSTPRLFLPALVAALTLAALPTASSESAGGTAKASPECVNVALEYTAERLGVFVSVIGVVGVGVASPHPGDGLMVAVFFLPELCTVGVPELIAQFQTVPEIPLPEDPTFGLLS